VKSSNSRDFRNGREASNSGNTSNSRDASNRKTSKNRKDDSTVPAKTITSNKKSHKINLKGQDSVGCPEYRKAKAQTID
jgi:hypothetical protein